MITKYISRFRASKALIALTFLIPINLFAQSVNFKKEIEPLITAKDYSEASKNFAIRFHNQNVDSYGALTQKAITFSYENMYSTREYLGYCYYYKGAKNIDPTMMDSALYYLNAAQGMQGMNDLSTLISLVKKKKAELVTEQKKELARQELEREAEAKRQAEEEYNQMYGEKTSILTYQSGEFLGSCLMIFKDEDGEEIMFYNPQVGFFADGENPCEIRELFQNDKFLVTYKLDKVQVHMEGEEGEGGTNETIDGNVILSIKLADSARAQLVNDQLLSECKSENQIMLSEIKKYEFMDPERIQKLEKAANNASTLESCEITKNNLSSALEDFKEKQTQIDAIAQAQKTLKAKSPCESCMISTTKKFLQSCVDVNGPQIQAQLCQCALGKDNTCNSIKGYKTFNYARYMEKPDISAAKWLLEQSNRFSVYHISETIAAVVVTPEAKTSKAKAVFLVKEAGNWKVIGGDDISEQSVLLYLMSRK